MGGAHRWRRGAIRHGHQRCGTVDERAAAGEPHPLALPSIARARIASRAAAPCQRSGHVAAVNQRPPRLLRAAVEGDHTRRHNRSRAARFARCSACVAGGDRLSDHAVQPVHPRTDHRRGHRLDILGSAAARRPPIESERNRPRVPHPAPRQPDQHLRRQDDHLHVAGTQSGVARGQLLRHATASARTCFHDITSRLAVRGPRSASRDMTFSSVTDLNGERKPRKPPSRELDSVEIRILGSLAEKQMATPEYYPLTLNVLVAACNQKSNREPVMELSEDDVQRALDRLQEERLVWKVMGGRAVRWEHNLDSNLQIDRPSKAALILLFLRGPQTPGELRGRSDRLYSFESIAEVEETLQRMDPLVREIVRGPGQKESRWTHVLSGAPAILPASAEGGMPTQSISSRLQRLEEQVAML